MADFTYQQNNTGMPEQYELDDIWFHNAPNMTTDRAMFRRMKMYEHHFL